MSSFKKPKRVEVEWIDAAGTPRWGTIESHAAQKPLRIRTMGYLIRDDKKVLVLVGSLSERGDAADSTVIPKSCVKRRRRVR